LEISLEVNRNQQSFIALEFVENLSPAEIVHLHALIDGRSVKPFFNPLFPRFVLLAGDIFRNGDPEAPIALEILREGAGAAFSAEVRTLSAIYFLPARGMFSKVWATRKRISEAKKSVGKPEWSPEDFPYSHFDGMAYIATQEEVKAALRDGRFRSALAFFYTKGRSLGHSPVLALGTRPNPGDLDNLVDLLSKTISVGNSPAALPRAEMPQGLSAPLFYTKAGCEPVAGLAEENELLLIQLHTVQEELERYFLENKKLLASSESLNAEKAHDENDKLKKRPRDSSAEVLWKSNPYTLPRKNSNGVRVAASDHSPWKGWPAETIASSGEHTRVLEFGKSLTLETRCDPGQKKLVVLELAEATSAAAISALQADINGVALTRHFNPDFPHHILFVVPSGASFPTRPPISFGWNPAKVSGSRERAGLPIQAVYFLPDRGMFSKVWASKKRIADSKKAGGKPEWSPEDFPYSHFDGMAYLIENPEVLEALESRKASSAIEYYHKSGRKGNPLPPLAWQAGPNPGSIENLVQTARDHGKNLLTLLQLEKEFHRTSALNLALDKQLVKNEELAAKHAEQRDGLKSELEAAVKAKDEQTKLGSERQSALDQAKSENDLLLNQLHTVQEELERYFLKNKESLAALDVRTKERDEQTKLASERQSELEAAVKAKDEQTKLASERQSELEAAVKAKEEQTKLASERQSELEAAVKAKDEQTKLASERQSELEAAVKERDTLNKTAGDRVVRIAELEAQAADQGERQKQIDEQMIRAETQLEMLKDLMRAGLE
jgi:hypothetical protein